MNSINRTHPLDILIPDNSLSLLEALVPFVDYSFKKPLVLFIKYRELMAIMQSLNNSDYISSCGFNCKPKNSDDFLSDILKFMPENFASSISQAKQMMSMFEMMNMAEAMKDMQGMQGMQDMRDMKPSEDASPYKGTNETSDANLFSKVIDILDNS